jgi:hypothetical protein
MQTPTHLFQTELQLAKINRQALISKMEALEQILGYPIGTSMAELAEAYTRAGQLAVSGPGSSAAGETKVKKPITKRTYKDPTTGEMLTKRPISGYGLFVKENYVATAPGSVPALAEGEKKDGRGGGAFASVADKWKLLSQEEKVVWSVKAKKLPTLKVADAVEGGGSSSSSSSIQLGGGSSSSSGDVQTPSYKSPAKKSKKNAAAPSTAV